MGFYKRMEIFAADRRRLQRFKDREKQLQVWTDVYSSARRSDALYGLAELFSYEDVFMGILDRAFSGVAKGPADTAAMDPLWANTLPNLLEMMTSTPAINGRRRTVATLTIVGEDGKWKAGLRDRDHSVSLWVSGDTVQMALEALEAALSLPQIPWRKSFDAQSRPRK